MPGLTIAGLTNLQRTTRAKTRKVKFAETLKYNRYAALEEFIWTGKSEGCTGTLYEERVRLRANTGATRGVNLYQVTASQKAPPVNTMQVPFIAKENKGIVFDRDCADLREDGLHRIQFRAAEAKEINIARWAMGVRRPNREQHRAFQEKLMRVLRLTEPVEESLHRESRQDEIERDVPLLG